MKLNAGDATEDGDGPMTRKEGGGDRGEIAEENSADKPSLTRLSRRTALKKELILSYRIECVT